jgi:hypothetical protein
MAVSEEVLEVVGTPENQIGSISINPVPAKDVVWIGFNNSNEGKNCMIELVDLTGRIVHTELANGNKMKIDVRGLAPGAYYLRVLDNERMIIKKLVIE